MTHVSTLFLHLFIVLHELFLVVLITSVFYASKGGFLSAGGPKLIDWWRSSTRPKVFIHYFTCRLCFDPFVKRLPSDFLKCVFLLSSNVVYEMGYEAHGYLGLSLFLWGHLIFSITGFSINTLSDHSLLSPLLWTNFCPILWLSIDTVCTEITKVWYLLLYGVSLICWEYVCPLVRYSKIWVYLVGNEVIQ